MIAIVLILGKNLELMHGTFVSKRKIPGPGRAPEQSRVTSAISCRHQSGSESQSCLSLVRIVRNQDLPAENPLLGG